MSLPRNPRQWRFEDPQLVDFNTLERWVKTMATENHHWAVEMVEWGFIFAAIQAEARLQVRRMEVKLGDVGLRFIAPLPGWGPSAS